jgi:DNA/RNA endonuclease YhcR with UshA esterase domain
MTGKLKVDGKYHNVEIAGSEYQGSLYNPLEDLKLADYNGKVITLGGYFLSISQSSGAFKFINMVVTSVAEAGDVVFPELSLSKTAVEVEPTATEYTFDVTSNLKWTLTASEGLTLDKTSGEGNATVKATFAANETEEAKVYTVTAKAQGAADKTLTITQATAAAPTVATAAEILAAADDENKKYQLTGYVTEVASAKYGNIYIKDYSAKLYVYGTYDAEGNRYDAFTTPVNAGDIVTVVGPKTSFNGNPQMKNVVVVDHKPVTDKTIAEFNAAAESTDVYYRLTGTATGIANAGQYGNFTLKNGEDEVYVYGLLSGWGGPKKQFESLGIKEGDTVTLVGVRSSHNNKIQVGNAFYVSHETPATE